KLLQIARSRVNARIDAAIRQALEDFVELVSHGRRNAGVVRWGEADTTTLGVKEVGALIGKLAAGSQKLDHVIDADIDALHGAGDQVGCAFVLAAREGRVVFVLVNADDEDILLGRRSDTAGASRAASAKDHVRALANELLGCGSALVRSGEAVEVYAQGLDI